MHIVFIVGVFPPESEPSAVMAGELTRSWSQEGHQVTVVCPFPNRPHGIVYPGFRRRWKTQTVENGVNVVRVWTRLINKQRSHMSRIFENLSFGLTSALAVLFLKKPDVVVLESWPVLAPLPMVLLCRIRRIPLANYIKDLYPEALAAAGLLERRSFLYRLMLRTDTFICHHSEHNIVISDAALEYVRQTRRLPDGKVKVVRDWIDLDKIRPYRGSSKWREEVSVPNDAVVFMYAGTMGYASRVNILTRVAGLLASRDDVHIVCIGEGPLKDEMLRDKEEFNVRNLTILPFQPHERVSEVQSCADVMLLLTSRHLGMSSVPSKFITYLAVGKPILCAADQESDAGRIVRENRLGIVVEPENPQAIAEGIAYLAGLGRESLREMGQRARAYAVAHYSKQVAVKGFHELLMTQIAAAPDRPGTEPGAPVHPESARGPAWS